MVRKRKQTFSKEDIHMAKRCMKRCLILLIRDRHIKTIMGYHLTLVRMAIIKKSTNNECWRGHGEKKSCCTEVLIHADELMRAVWRFLRNLKTELSYDPKPHSWAYTQP